MPRATVAGAGVLPADLVRELEPIREKLHGATPNAVLPVVGSGLSRPLTSWRDLLMELIESAPKADRKRLLAELEKDKYLKVAQMLESVPEVGPARIAAAVQHHYQNPKVACPEVYDLVVKLPVQHFVTTNFDPWLKDALARRLGRAPKICVPGRPGAFSDLGPGSPAAVLMLHGDAEDAARCVLSARAYRQLTHGDRAFSDALGALIQQRHWLFIGHSLSDPDIDAVLDRWREVFGPPGGAPVPRHSYLGVGLDRFLKAELLERGIQAIDYAAPRGTPGDRRDPYRLLPALLKHLATPPDAKAPAAKTARARRATTGAASRARGLTEWERTYLSSKLAEWTGNPYGPLAAHAGNRDLRRVALYVSLHAAPQPWCYVDKHGKLIVKPRRERRPDAPRRRGQGAGAELPEGRDGEARAPFLEQALSHAKLRVLVLEGEGGSGKTVLLQHVAYVLACHHLREPAPAGHHLDLRALQKGAPLLRVPVLLDARRIAEAIGGHGSERALREAVSGAFGGAKVLSPEVVLEGLKHGRYLLLIDALDEVPGVAQRQQVLLALAGEARKKWPLRLVLTTRPAAYTGARLPPELPALPLAPMNEGDAERLIERWAQAQGRPAEARRGLRDALFGVREQHGIENVLENPLLLTCLLLVHEQHKRLPDSTAALYARMVEVLCTARDWPEVKAEDKRRALEIVCEGMQEQGGTAWPLERAVQALANWRPALVPAGDPGAQFVERLALETGLLRLDMQSDERGADVRLVRPWHRSFQEYLAARALAVGGDSVEVKTERLFTPRAGGSARVEDPAWEGVLRFLVGVHGAAGDDNARRYVQTLYAALSHPERPRREGRILGLAASALSEYAEHFQGHALLEALPRELVEAFEDRGATWPWRDRVLALDALGRLPGGDPRLQRDPWVRVPAGRFKMGGDSKAYGSAPEHEVDVPEFQIRRWPVTVSEYRAFVDARGYSETRWWDEAPDRSEPALWGRQTRHPNRPVVYVTWFEARAFCRWAMSVGWAPEGHVITLPTEEEWEYAARGSEGRDYAWGPEPPGAGDAARASHQWEGGDTPDAATPVGAFPTGHTPARVWDLTGNVWEWTACRYRAGGEEWHQGDTSCHQDDIDCHFGDSGCHQDDKRGDKVTPPARLQSLRAAPRVVRGGSWRDYPLNLRAAYRFWLDPGLRHHFLGFRVVCRGSRQHVGP